MSEPDQRGARRVERLSAEERAFMCDKAWKTINAVRDVMRGMEKKEDWAYLPDTLTRRHWLCLREDLVKVSARLLPVATGQSFARTAYRREYSRSPTPNIKRESQSPSPLPPPVVAPTKSESAPPPSLREPAEDIKMVAADVSKAESLEEVRPSSPKPAEDVKMVAAGVSKAESLEEVRPSWPKSPRLEDRVGLSPAQEERSDSPSETPCREILDCWKEKDTNEKGSKGKVAKDANRKLGGDVVQGNVAERPAAPESQPFGFHINQPRGFAVHVNQHYRPPPPRFFRGHRPYHNAGRGRASSIPVSLPLQPTLPQAGTTVLPPSLAPHLTSLPSHTTNNTTRILLLSNFSPELKTRDIQSLFGEWEDDRGGFKIKWSDDVSCWIVFNDAAVAKRAYLTLLSSPPPALQPSLTSDLTPKLTPYTGPEVSTILNAVQNRPRSRSVTGGHSRKGSALGSGGGANLGGMINGGLPNGEGGLRGGGGGMGGGHSRGQSFGRSGRGGSFGQKQMKDMMEGREEEGAMLPPPVPSIPDHLSSETSGASN